MYFLFFFRHVVSLSSTIPMVPGLLTTLLSDEKYMGRDRIPGLFLSSTGSVFSLDSILG